MLISVPFVESDVYFKTVDSLQGKVLPFLAFYQISMDATEVMRLARRIEAPTSLALHPTTERFTVQCVTV